MYDVKLFEGVSMQQLIKKAVAQLIENKEYK